MGRMMYIARNTKTGRYISVDNITDSDIESIADFTKVRANANAKKVLCYEQAPFICPSCKRAVYFRKESKKNRATFCHYATENECLGKVRSDVLKRIFIQMIADNALRTSGGLRIKALSDTIMLPENMLSFSGSSVSAHSYRDGVLLSDWNVELYGRSENDVVKVVQAELALVRDSEYIFFCFDETRKKVVEKLISEGIYCTAFMVCWDNNISLANLLCAFEDVRSGKQSECLCSLQLLMSPQLYFYNQAKFFAQVGSSVVCPASGGTHIVNTDVCMNCPCRYSTDNNVMVCFGKLAISSSALLSQIKIFDKFTDEAIADRYDVFIRDDTDQTPILGLQKEPPIVFGICDECGEPYELRGGLDMKPVRGIQKLNVHSKGLFLYCSKCGHYERLKCHCGDDIIPYVNTYNGVVFVGCADRDYSNSGIGSCKTESLTIFTNEDCTQLADEVIIARDIRLWAKGRHKIYERLAGSVKRYARLVEGLNNGQDKEAGK